MDNIVIAINNLTNEISESNNIWNSLLVPIIVGLIPSVILIIQNCIIEKRNRKLQLQIQKRDEKLQLYNNILDIYNTYNESIMKINNIINDERFYSTDLISIRNFMNDILDAGQYNEKVIKSCNQAKILFDFSNKVLADKLEKLKELYGEITYKIVAYVGDENYLIKANDAWDKIIKLYPNIPRGNIQIMKLNQEANRVMESICITDEVKELKELYKRFAEDMNYENFDKFFEEYLQIKD